jgi:hypothetical protein
LDDIYSKYYFINTEIFETSQGKIKLKKSGKVLGQITATMTTAMLTPIFAQLAHGLSAEYGLDEAAILALCQDVMKSCVVKVSNVDETPAEAPKVTTQKCSWVMKRGGHEGESCQRNSVDGQQHCKQHSLLAEKEKTKPQPEIKPKCTYMFTRGDNAGKQCTSNAVKCTMPIHVVACSSHEKSLYQKALKDQEAVAKSTETVPEEQVAQPQVVAEPKIAPITEEPVQDPKPVAEEKKPKKRAAPKKK